MPASKKCKGCGNDAKTKKGWCSIECYRKNQSLIENKGRFKDGIVAHNKKYEKINDKCSLCGKDFTHTGNGKYCSMLCLNKSKIKIEETECSNCGKKIRKRIGKSGLVYCSKNCYNNYRKNNIVNREDSRKKVKLLCQTCDNEYEVSPSRTKKSKYCSIQCHNIGNVINMPKKDTSIELKIEDLLKNLNIKYVKNTPISNVTIPDFFIEPNITIYADGDYWHSIKSVKIRDVKINKYLKENKYVVLRYNEKDINNNIQVIKKDIQKICC